MRLLKLDIEVLMLPSFFLLNPLACALLFELLALFPYPQHYEVLSDLPTPTVPLHSISELLDSLYSRPPPPSPTISRLVCLGLKVFQGKRRWYIVGIENCLIICVVHVEVDSVLVNGISVSLCRTSKRGRWLGQEIWVANWLINLLNSFLRGQKGCKKAVACLRHGGENS